MVKLILALFVVNNAFLFARTFKERLSRLDIKYINKNTDYYTNGQINNKTMARRLSMALLRNKSNLSKMLIYYVFIFPILLSSEVLTMLWFLLNQGNGQHYGYFLLFFSSFIIVINIFYLCNRKSVIEDRLLLVIKIIIIFILLI